MLGLRLTYVTICSRPVFDGGPLGDAAALSERAEARSNSEASWFMLIILVRGSGYTEPREMLEDEDCNETCSWM